MVNSTIATVQALERDYGTVNCKEAANDPRLLALHKKYAEEKNHSVVNIIQDKKLFKAQVLLDNLNLPKYKIAERAGYNKDYFSQLCVDGYLDDAQWYANRQRKNRYEYYCDNTLLAKGSINQIAIMVGKSPSTIRSCMLASYKKYHHEHTYRLVKI